MSELTIHPVSKTVTTEYKIEGKDINHILLSKLGLDPKNTTITWDLDDGRDYDGHYETPPKVRHVKITVVER